MSDDTRHVIVTVTREEELDADRIEKWVHANFSDGDEIQIQDIDSGEILYDNIGCDTL